MTLKSRSDHYGTVAVTIHWLSALLIVALLGSGFRSASLVNVAAKEPILSVHVPLGVSILILTLARIVWWWLGDRKPDPVASGTAWQASSAKAVHILFYIAIIGMAASGIAMMVLSGAGNILFGNSQAGLPDFQTFLPRIPHGIGARLMVALLVVHAGAALYHHFIKKDGLLWRMWFTRSRD